MALPTLADKIEAVEDKLEKENIVSQIAQAVFKSAKISSEAAAKFAVAPSVPQMVNDVLDDLKSGSIDKFNKAMDKLDKLVRTLGIDLKKYNKELANFAEKREEKIIKSEEKIQTLRENNIVADITKAGDVNVLSQKEIEGKQKNLRDTEKRIKDLEKKIAKDTKQIQDPGLFQKELKTTAQFNKKEEIKRDSEELEQKKKERDKAKDVLGKRGDEQPGILQRGREGVGNFVDEYVPTPIAEVGSAFVDGLMGPVNAVKELGSVFGGLLKPLRIFKPLLKGLLGGLKKFALGLKAAFVSMLPYIAILALVGLALYGLYKLYKKLFPNSAAENIEEKAQKQAEAGNLRQSGFIKESIKEKPKFLDSKGQVIEFGKAKTAEEIEKDFQPQTEMPEAFKKEILPGSYYDKYKIQKLNKSTSSNFMNPENRTNLQVPTSLKPVEETKKESTNNVSQVVDNSQKVQSDTIVAGGLDGVSNRDFQNHILQTV
jgi:hypothetical protein